MIDFNLGSFAGSDTTAISLRAVFYFLLQNPAKYQKLKKEISKAEDDDKFSTFVSFEQGSKLIYLQAVIKESLRLHPGVSYPLERIVPSGGAYLCGHHLPAGTAVGVHAWVVHRDTRIFGDDANEFRPERWIDSDMEKMKQMNRAFLAFGAGSRTCLGKHISMLEMTKLVSQLLRKFDFEWASGEEDWRISGSWFAKQTGLHLRLKTKMSEKPRDCVSVDIVMDRSIPHC